MKLSDGVITPKERDLWQFVLSNYGTEEFSTKELEKQFNNASYATIRSFVMKFEELNLLQEQRLGNRNRYRVNAK